MSSILVKEQVVQNSHYYDNADELLLKIADYVHNYKIDSTEAFNMAKHCLLDSLSCAALAMDDVKCKLMLGPLVPDTIVPNGSRVPGTNFKLDPYKAAFDIGCLIRWLDYNDTWLAAEWGHPSDNLGAILSVADFISRVKISKNKQPLHLKEVFEAMIKAYEIQGVLALNNSFNKVGLDHVVLVKVASTAVVSKMLGGNMEQTISALSNAWVDGQSLRTYRHGINTCARKSWAAGDACSRAVRLAGMSVYQSELGCPNPLSAETWGFFDVSFNNNPITLSQDLGNYVIENILFKVKYPAEFHGQTAVECAFKLHPKILGRINDIERIEITTTEAGMRIINKTGKLHNYADRDHCLQYMTAIGLLYGMLEKENYLDEFVEHEPKIDFLREKMIVKEDKSYSVDYMDPNKRSIANAVQVFFNDGSSTEKVEIHYPLGHRNRRSEAMVSLLEKFNNAIFTHYPKEIAEQIAELWYVPDDILQNLDVASFMGLLAIE